MTDQTSPPTFSILPEGCKTPEGNARLAKAMEEFNDAKAAMANYFASLCRDCAGGSGNPANQARALAKRMGRNDTIRIDPEELAELLDRHHDAQQDFMGAVCGRPTKAEREAAAEVQRIKDSIQTLADGKPQ